MAAKGTIPAKWTREGTTSENDKVAEAAIKYFREHSAGGYKTIEERTKHNSLSKMYDRLILEGKIK